MDLTADIDEKKLISFINKNPYLIFRHIIRKNHTYKVLDESDVKQAEEITSHLSLRENLNGIVGGVFGAAVTRPFAPKNSLLSPLLLFVSFTAGAVIGRSFLFVKEDVKTKQLEKLMEKYSGWNHNANTIRLIRRDFAKSI